MDSRCLYCDESGTHEKSKFCFGALCCSPTRAEILRHALKDFRSTFSCTREMKWTKVSVHMSSAYKAMVDLFFNDPFSYFRVLEVERGLNWKQWAPNEETRFFKAYYVFLRRHMSPLFCRYGVYLDYKPGKPYRWDSLRFAINGAVQRDYGLRQKSIYALVPRDSKRDDLLQLVDVLLGACTSEATAPAKQQLTAHVLLRGGQLTRSGKKKIEIEKWSPYEAMAA